jgi:hypothetical protein
MGPQADHRVPEVRSAVSLARNASNLRSITHLVSCPSRNRPTNSSDEPNHVTTFKLLRLSLVLLTISCGVSDGASRSEKVTFQVETEEFSNAVYNLACLSNRIPCTKASFEKFWHEKQTWTPEDQAQLDTWNKVFDAIVARVPKSPNSPFLPNYDAYFPSNSASGHIVAAGLDAHSPADFRRRAAALAPAGEIAQLASALDHFERRLRPWWRSKGQPYAATRRRILQTVVDAPEVSAIAGKVMRFVESEITMRRFYVHLIPRDDTSSDAATATVVGNHVLGELTDFMKPAEMMPLMMHELTHAFYARAPLRLHQKLIQEFVASPEPQSQALYSILNEGIATAVQLSLIREPQSDEDAYRDPYIPRIGRAVAPYIKQALDNGPTLFHGFLDTYIKASVAELKEESFSPRFTLITAMRLSVGNLDAANKACDTDFPTHWSASFSERDRFPELNLEILITYDKLDAIEGNWDQIVPLSKAHRGFVFSDKRNNKGRTYVLAGRDDATVTELVKKLSEIRTKTQEGILLTVD